MSLSYQEKIDLNYALMKIYRLKLLDKEDSVISTEGRLTHFQDPANYSLFGSIAEQPDQNYNGPQQPNSMGMVLLVSPHNKKIAFSVAGQFDVVHRYIPDIQETLIHLIHDENGIRDTQQILVAHKRYTVVFSDVQLVFDTENNSNEWLDIKDGKNIQKSLDDLKQILLQDPRVYKSCQLSHSGSAELFMPWDKSICDQEALNESFKQHLFINENEVLPYSLKIRGRIRPAPYSISRGSETYLVEIFLENNTTKDTGRAFGIYNPHFLDVQFTAKLNTGMHHFLPHRLAPKDFRYKPGNNVPGYGITTSIEQVDKNTFITNAMPIFSLPKIENPSPDELGMEYPPDFDVLAKKPVEMTQALIDAITRYEEQWQEQIKLLEASGGNGDEVDESRRSLMDLIREKEQIIDGVNLLKTKSDLRKCFSLMNEAMLEAVKIQGKSFTGWRLFQLGFILTQIRAIYERTAPENELTEHLQTAEVLWFPTGGGKTEAYLGLITMAMFHERMMERKYGVTAWLRFPLRMLSVQQFQRLSYVVAQANILKQREKINGHPFTIGYFTGAGTPSSISTDHRNENSSFLTKLSKERLHELKFISDCPYCEEDTVDIVADIAHSRIKHVCLNPNCWSNSKALNGSYGEGIKGELGIYVSDEECYRYIPSIMVGTIDKLSNIGHNRRFRYFFGGATHFCPDHGFSFEGRCVHNRIIQNDDGKYTPEQCPNNSRTSLIKTVSLGKALFPGVSFFVQDELHLLSENTGNFDAHYETLFNAIQIANGGRKPKNLAATATIKEYEHHVKHLYLAKPRRFPVPGFSLNESFYSRIILVKNKVQIRRLYIGILPIGYGKISEKATALASSRFLCMVDELREQLRTDPHRISELLGFSHEKADELIEYIGTYLNTNLMYVNSFQSLSEVQHALEDAQSQFLEREILQLSSKSTLEEIQKAIKHIENKAPDDQTRQIIATSVVSHGVDIHRLNFMIISGWPKSISEYMQSSARAGRIEPGIVLNVFNSNTLFQNNVFMNFMDYHKFMDRLVESVPINRFSPNLIDKTLPGIFCAWILNWASGQQSPWGSNVVKNAGQVKLALKDTSHNARTELKNLIVSSLSIPACLTYAFDSRVIADFERTLDRKIEIALNQLEGMSTDISEEYLSDALERLIGNRPMRSLRDIESQIRVLPQFPQSGELLEALSRRN